jgi:hypothetical protein
VQGHGALPDDQELALARREDGDVAISKDDIRRVPLGHYTRPTGDPLAGQRIVVSAFLVPHPGGTVLFDTGIGEGEPEFDRHYRVVRRELREGLAALGVGLDEIRLVANCHLHADHCGGNPTLADRTVFVQRAELAAARTPDYTIPGLVDFMGRPTKSSTGRRRSCPECGWCRRPAILTATSRWWSTAPRGRWCCSARPTSSPPTGPGPRSPGRWPARASRRRWPQTRHGWVSSKSWIPAGVLLAHDLASVERAPF